MDNWSAIAFSAQRRPTTRHSPARRPALQLGRSTREVCSPVVNRLIQRQHDQVEVLEDGALLDLVPEEEGDGVMEGGQDALEHELVLVLGPDHVEGEVERGLVEDQLVGVEENVAYA